MSSPASYLVIDLPIGATAAVLTAFEYILTSIATVAASAAVQGTWLLSLHRGGKAKINIHRRSLRSLRTNTMTFLLGIWLVIVVALVESSMTPSVRPSKDIISTSKDCVNIDTPFDPDLLNVFVPSIHLVVEPWALAIAFSLNCHPYGISSIGTGGRTTLRGVKVDMMSPVCASPSESNYSHGNISAIVSKIKMEDYMMEFKPGKTAFVELLPFEGQNLGVSKLNYGEQAIDSVPLVDNCHRQSISDYHTKLNTQWRTLHANSENVSMNIHQKICELHKDGDPNPLTAANVSTCGNILAEEIDGACIRKMATKLGRLYTVDLMEMAALFVGQSQNDASYACLNATIRYEYTFITPEVVTSLENEAQPKFPVLIPTRMDVLDGYCERTVHILGRSALLYTVDAEWRDTYMSKMGRLARYHAFMIALSSSQFPLESFESSTNSECRLRFVMNTTHIPIGWEFYMMGVGVVIAIALMVTGISFRMLYIGEAWKVGSAEWTLSKLRENDSKEKDEEEIVDVIEVVGVIGAEEEEGGEYNGSSNGDKEGGYIDREIKAGIVGGGDVEDGHVETEEQPGMLRNWQTRREASFLETRNSAVRGLRYSVEKKCTYRVRTIKKNKNAEQDDNSN